MNDPITPLQLLDISLILQYISPPSQLQANPLPPHLISSPLRQRHHFLQLTPDDPVAYLSWPSPHQQQALDLLEAFRKPHDDGQYASFPIRYTSDPESTYAHVRITPDDLTGLRLVFQWDHADGWKYHNLALMPFPPANIAPAHDAVSRSLLDPLQIHPHTDFLQDNSPTVDVDSHDDDDAYWDAYGQSDDTNGPPIFDGSRVDSQGGTEDAYWAQYASVQGSGDSTLPSPLPIKRKQDIDPDQPIIFEYSSARPAVYNPLDPPSPSALSRRLEELPPRSRSPSLLDNSPLTDSATPSPRLASELMTTAHGFVVVEDDDTSLGGTPEEEALKDSIRGIYRLWKAGRQASIAEKQSDDERFMSIVYEVIGRT